MKKNLLFLLFALMCGLNANAQTGTIVTKDMAVTFAKNFTNNPSIYDYYVGPTRYKFSSNQSGIVIGDGMEDCWLVFVDLKPNAGWEHPCEYYYIKQKYIIGDKNFIVRKDSVCPPANVNLEPYKKTNRYGTKSRMKPYVPKIQSNSPNVAAGHTYAVIVNGGMTATANNERYWNDCSFMYKTLRNRYGIPKQNIKVLMSDGTSDGKDMLLTDGGFASSPLDLDDDGSPDIEYAATKANLSAVLGGLAQKLTDDDHLFLFFMDHGGYDNVSKKSYIYMWNYEMMYPSELASYLNPINAGYISMLFGQCNAGGFIEPLKATNRIITTACKDTELSYACEEIPFDEFVYHWTSAVNGYDAYGNAVSASENISLLNAWKYASRQDMYANGGSRYATETPMTNYFTFSVAYDLSFANIPPVVDLCFDEYSEPLISYLRTREYEKQTNPYYYKIDEEDVEAYRKHNFWSSPYIWLRNNPDGVEVQKTEKPIIDEDGTPIYMYVKVRNKGVKPYISGMRVKSFWAQTSLVLTEASWKGYSTQNLSHGGAFSEKNITDKIQPGQNTVVQLRKFFTDDPYIWMQEEGANLCVLAFLTEKESTENIPVDSNLIAAVWDTDKLAQSNVNILSYADLYKDTLLVLAPNAKPYTCYYDLRVMNTPSINSLFSEADVSLKMSSDLVSSWNNGGQIYEDIEKDKNSQGLFNLKSTSSKLGRLKLTPNQKGKIGLCCNFYADKAITERKEYDIDIALIDNATGQCLGGETFRITQEPRPAINPQVETALQSGKVVLTATNVSESAKYYWYDASGKLVGTGSTFNVPAGQQASNYTVRVEATSDGAISYSQATMVHESSIRNVNSTPKEINVTFESPVSSNATLRLASSTGNMPASDYGVESGTTTYSIPAANMPAGVYQVTLIEDGTVTGTKKFTK